MNANAKLTFFFIFNTARCEEQIDFPWNPSVNDIAFALAFVQCEWAFSLESIAFEMGDENGYET